MPSTSLQSVLKPPASDAEALARLEKLAVLLDSQFRVPGTEYRVGLDSMLGLIPGIGDTIGAITTGYLLRESHRLGAPLSLRLKMLGNLGIDWFVGLIPLLGDLFDAHWRANTRNVALLRQHLEKRGIV